MKYKHDILFLLCSMLYMEILLRIFTGEYIFNKGLIYATIISIIISLIIYIVLSIVNYKCKNILVGIILLFISLIFGSQMIYYYIFKTFYTVFSATKGTQVFEFMQDILYNLSVNIHWILLLFVPLILYICIPRSPNISNKFIWIKRTVGIFIIILLVGFLNIESTQINNHKITIYDDFCLSGINDLSINKLGLLTSMWFDMKYNLFEIEPNLKPPELLSYKQIEDTPASIELSKNEPAYNMINIDFIKLINETTDENLKNMHQYFSVQQPTSMNSHTGIFKGYNLILITAESFSNYSIDKNLTPTLYKMKQEGFNFSNFYNPIWNVSTSDGEYAAITGLIPKPGIWSMYYSGFNYMPYAMGNMLKPLGYKTMAYHNHTYDYYERQISHPNLGYEYKGLGNGLNVTPTWPESDIEMMEISMNDYIKSEPFHAYYITVSGHMRYTFSGNFIAMKNKDLVDDLQYEEGGKAYIATQIELDKALEYMLQRLEKEGIAERTLIVISPDHYPFGLDKKDLDELAGHKIEGNFELFKSNLLIYSKGMESEIIDKPVSSIDILPTILNLMGLEYDSRLLMGRDIFSDSSSLVMFLNRSFITDVGKYNSIKDEFIPNEGVIIEKNYVKMITDEINLKFYYSAKILNNDYYKIVLNQ